MSVIEVQPPMDPRKAECSGFYLYGSGYFSREDGQAAILRGQHAASFCNEECPIMQRCMEQHVKRVRAQDPEATEKYAEILVAARRRDIPQSLVEATLARQGTPDPYMAHALRNFKRGIADRKARQHVR